jgi:uroporphyrinogen decarboxylase
MIYSLEERSSSVVRSSFSQDFRLLAPFAGKISAPPPIWLMRQAGRHLPEYHEVRAKAGSFLDLCYTPKLAAEVTLQPIRRYGLDAAIVFSDILVVPHALGQKVEFVEGCGPRLDPIRSERGLTRLKLSATRPTFERVFETVANVRHRLPKGVALIGFCGAPWTVATYMVSGGKSADQADAQADAMGWARTDPDGFGRLMDRLIEASVDYLAGQVVAGANVLQIFDTWAGRLSGAEFERWVCRPTKAIVARVKERYPGVPVIGFPLGASASLGRYVAKTGVDGVSCDAATSVDVMARELAGKVVVQGNLDPLLLASGGPEMELQVARILAALRGRPFIFNLGHGVLPHTPPENVMRLVKLVRESR